MNSKISNLESTVVSKCSLAEVETKIEDIVTSKLIQSHSDSSGKFECDVRKTEKEKTLAFFISKFCHME